MRKMFAIAILSAAVLLGCGGMPKAGRMIRISQGDKTWDVCSLEIYWPYQGDGRLVFRDKNDLQVVLSGDWRTEETSKPCY